MKKELKIYTFVHAKGTHLWQPEQLVHCWKKLLMTISVFQGAVGFKGELGTPGIPGEKLCWFAT